ncbi:hypothetical protein MSG28_014060 [Choristoneura fumiferana]|uniref:Uncharacterized protein n=2 Tax=Choristoneura fumiferana TaxID=7141 RepID=A0ACC0JFQ4_CHOFU|nr:hypothetical protein MSG28_014060 [Choristoneura fumiferana]
MLRLSCLLVALQLACCAEYLLPGDVVPHHYDLSLLYDVDPATNYSFFASVDILKATSKIVLHAQDFSIASDKVLLTSDANTYSVPDVRINDTYNFLTLTLSQPLEEGENYTLTIPFYGNLKPGLDGVHLVTTQFEAISARKGFPCFDEPMKPQQDFVWDHYSNSVPMSTYLVAWVVSKFAALESPPALSDTKFKIWARADAIDQAEYASTTGPKVLSYFEKWFGVKFPLPKQDMVAIPDFGAGAMENWGLITYRETALLYDKEQSSFLNKERVAEWFGNLVTMKWWSDLWLNEGFATFAASVGVAAVEPDWRAEEGSAVSVPIDDPKRISEIFDEISYRKGSALIRMMTIYLIKHSYHNAEQDDLWHELTLVNQQHGGLTRNVTVKTVMDTWTKQTGYPLLTVTRDYSGKTLTITQVPGCEENAIELFQRWMDSDSPDEDNPYLEWSITEGSEVRLQDAAAVVGAVTRSTVGFYFKRWRESNNKYLEESQLAVNQAIEKAQYNIDWLKKNKKVVVAKMREFSTLSDYLSEDVSKGSNEERLKCPLENVIFRTFFFIFPLTNIELFSPVKISFDVQMNYKEKPNFMNLIYSIHNISSARLKSIFI